MKKSNETLRKKRSLKNILLLATGMLVLSLFSADIASAQELKDKLSKTDNILEHYETANVDTNYTYKWNNDSQQWQIYNRELKYFNEKQNVFAHINQRHLDKDDTWENYDRTINSYDEKGKILESLHQKWNPSLGDWVNLKIKTITYNERGERSEVLYHEWRQALDRWISTTRYLITYNRNGEESNILIKTYDPATNMWEAHQRFTFEYENDYGKPDETLVEEWDPFTKTWDNRGKYLMSYDYRGNRTLETHVNWNQSMSKWINGIKYKREFTKDLLQNEILLRWDFQGNEWHRAIKNIFEYDENGELVRSVEEEWNTDSSDWVIKNRFLYTDIKNISNQKNK